MRLLWWRLGLRRLLRWLRLRPWRLLAIAVGNCRGHNALFVHSWDELFHLAIHEKCVDINSVCKACGVPFLQRANACDFHLIIILRIVSSLRFRNVIPWFGSSLNPWC